MNTPGEEMTVSDYVLKCGRQANEIDRLREENGRLREAILYTLDISMRQHGDDYAYDGCWDRLRKALENKHPLDQ